MLNEFLECDVLVIGGGGAALRAALAAEAAMGRAGRAGTVLLVTKGRLGESGVTATACSDRMAFHATLPYTEPGGPDNWKYHAADIYRIGGYVSDADLAMILAFRSGKAVEFLDELGVPFVKGKDGRISQFLTDGSEYPRACYTGPYTANHIEEALVRRVRGGAVRVLENCMVTDLIKDESGKRVVGAFVLDMAPRGVNPACRGGVAFDGLLTLVKARATVLATGGAGEAFAISVFPPGQTGDGYAMAYRAGAELMNMEFLQIGLCSVKTKLACSGSLMRAIPRFLNDSGEEFLPGYFPAGTGLTKIWDTVFAKGSSWPVSYEHPSHIIDVAVQKELFKGRKVYLDLAANPLGFDFESLNPEYLRRYHSEMKKDLGRDARATSPLERLREINPDVIEWLAARDIHLTRGDRIEIAPAIQHFQGGVKIRTGGETSLAGLYAAGEAAGGQHGANRPGGNSLLDGQVFGEIAGRSAAAEARAARHHSVSRDVVSEYLAHIGDYAGSRTGNRIGSRPGSGPDGSGCPGRPTASEVRAEVQTIAYASASVIRTAAGLENGLRRLLDLKGKGFTVDEMGLGFAFETGNLFEVVEMILRACLMRCESRGPHLFFKSLDSAVPDRRNDEEWSKYIVIRKAGPGDGDRMVLDAARPVAWDEAEEKMLIVKD